MIPRLAADALPQNLAVMLRPRVERLGYLGEFFRCAAHQPAALVSFMAFTENLKHALPDRLTETVALTVSTRSGECVRAASTRTALPEAGFRRKVGAGG